MRLVRNIRQFRLLPRPRAKRLLNRLQHRRRVEISHHQEERIFRRVKVFVNLQQIRSLIRRNLRLGRRYDAVWMLSKQNLAQSFARQESRLGPIQFHFFQLQPSFALKFPFYERRIARQLIHQPEQRFRHLRQSRKCNRARIRAQAPQILFDPPADAQLRPRAQHRRRHLGQSRSALDRRRISRAERKLSMQLRYRMRLRQQYLEPVRQTHTRPLRPGHRALCSQRRYRCSRTLRPRLRGHYAASFLSVFTGARNTIARFSARKYFFATACTSSLFTAKNPSRIEFTNSALLSNNVKHASRCMSPYRGIPPRPPSSVE